jgi:hypothetical protein
MAEIIDVSDQPAASVFTVYYKGSWVSVVVKALRY